jgi:hypothetical protein
MRLGAPSVRSGVPRRSPPLPADPVEEARPMQRRRRAVAPRSLPAARLSRGPRSRALMPTPRSRSAPATSGSATVRLDQRNPGDAIVRCRRGRRRRAQRPRRARTPSTRSIGVPARPAGGRGHSARRLFSTRTRRPRAVGCALNDGGGGYLGATGTKRSPNRAGARREKIGDRGA